MRYAHLIHYLNSAPWAILPEKLLAIVDLIELRAAGLTLSDSEIEARIGPRSQPAAAQRAPTSVAVLPIFGTIANRAGLLHRSSGGMSVESFSREFAAAVKDPDVGAIVLDIDSPGGSTSGIEELADQIHQGRSEKRIVASVNSLAASAAYWLAASAHEIALTPSGHVGSIGVIGVHMDLSEKAKREGVTVTIITSSKFKAEANEFSPLSADAKAHLARLVNDRHRSFVADVARGRGVATKTVNESFGQGRVLHARDALSAGMVDSIETTDQVLARVADRVRLAGGAARTAASVLQLDSLARREAAAPVAPVDKRHRAALEKIRALEMGER